MGNSKSKIGSGARGKARGKGDRDKYFSGNDVSTGGRGDEHDDVELRLLRRTIENDPEIFILNNLMMCVQFFQNYEEDIEHVKKSLTSTREAALNERLPPQKHVLLPDILQEHITKNVGFFSTRQTLRPTIEPLQPVRIYTVHDNIDITEQSYPIHYSIVNDSMMYNILLKPTEHEGYVQLQLLDEFGTKSEDALKGDEADLSSIAEGDDELYSDADSVYVPKPRANFLQTKRYQQGTLRGSKQEHARSLPDLQNAGKLYEGKSTRHAKAMSDYENGSSTEEHVRPMKRIYSKGEYRRGDKETSRTKLQESSNNSRASSASSGYKSGNYVIDSYSSSKLCQNLRLGENLQDEELDQEVIENAELPHRSFKKVTYTTDGKIYDPREERKLLNSKQRRIKLALKRHNYDLFYVSSTEFMRHFINVFIHRIADSLGFDRETVEDTRREGCVLYCDKVMISKSFKLSRIEQYEIIPAIWLQWPICAQEWLDRPRSTWPDYNDVEKIKDFGCYVVPEGFVPRRGSSNLIQDLEWQLTFPTAERYLETCMTQAQVQVYLLALMLHKTFMRPIFDTMFGLTTVHIRHKLFWLIEENDRPSRWPDNRMGECLLKLLNSMYNGISQNEPILRDYFVRERNLFQRVPIEHLLYTQKQLKRIIENPVMYVFHAMENILYSENFFPRLDYELLLRILTVDTLSLVNPALVHHISRHIPQKYEDRVSQDERYARGGFWDAIKQKQKKHSGQSVTNRTLINPRKATDSIIEISIRCAQLESSRLCALLDFFIQHFIKIAERCHHYRAHAQKALYLDHADRLSILLFEHHRFKGDARAYRDKISVLKKKNANSRMPDDPPETPKRNEEAAIFVAPLKNRFAPQSSEQASISSDNETDHESKRPGRSTDRVRNVTIAVVHDAQYNEPDEEDRVKERVKIAFKETTPSSTRKLDKHQQVKALLKPSDPSTQESTYV